MEVSAEARRSLRSGLRPMVGHPDTDARHVFGLPWTRNLGTDFAAFFRRFIHSVGNDLNRKEIASRLRGLIGGQEQGDLGAVASRLGIDEVSLRMSIDPLAPYPTLDVLAAIVAHYGVDPTWLITGEYNPGSHRTAVESEAKAVESMRAMLHALQPTMWPQADAPPLRLIKDA